MDRISNLHDALLLNILMCLRSAPAAARTSALSRRWRHVWVHLPELVLHGRHALAPTTSFLNSVDAVLAAHSAPAVLNLEIDVPSPCCCLCRANRVAPWMRFASQRLQGFSACLDAPTCPPSRKSAEKSLSCPRVRERLAWSYPSRKASSSGTGQQVPNSRL
ncbi:hypothetical protein ACQ4PT_063058 [Festuca glaucescens]